MDIKENRKTDFNTKYKNVYRKKIWKYLPKLKSYGLYNGVKVVGESPAWIKDDRISKAHRLFDFLVPWSTPSKIPDFKAKTVNVINDKVEKGDRYITVGGGSAVTAVNAAKIVGREGKVIIYEADEKRCEDIKNTLSLNVENKNYKIVNKYVGNVYSKNNSSTDGNVNFCEMPSCDVLELDCEGAELEIIKNIKIRPRLLIAELHHEKDFCPYKDKNVVVDEAEDAGYSVKILNGPWMNGLLVGVYE